MSRLDQVVAALKRAEGEGRLHHAYLLSGPESPAKLECAQRLAAFFSARKGVSESAARERIVRGNHPDFLVLRPEGALIGVDEVRALPKALAFPPLEASRRVVVIEGGMNTQAANAILKILEEPPGHTMFFLLCREPSEFLPTIVSRCQPLRFGPLSDEELRQALAGRAEAGSRELAAWSEGSLARAEFILGREGGLLLQRKAAEMMLELWEASPRIPSSVFLWAEGLDSDEDCAIAIESWEVMLRDLSFAAAGAAAEAARFPSFFPRLKPLADRGGNDLLAELADKSAAINRFRVYRQFNGNLRLDIATLVAELQIFSVGKSRSRE
jgi:DNA polymerase-3 subunit delta'